jgi:hypothetical protein
VLALAVLEITVLTMSPGGDAFARFGHTAIRVEDDAGMRVYNFGAFKGDDPQIASRFLSNTIPYYLSVSEAGRFAGKYRDRTVVGQVLNLDADEARRLSERLAMTALPGNRSYKYDWFRNNCTTRARDFIDEVIGGSWHAQLVGQPPRRHGTIRALLHGALWSVPSGASICELTLNSRSDEPLDAWQELAMPADLMLALREAHRSDGRPLVGDEWVWEGPAPRPRTEPAWLQPIFEGVLLYLLIVGALMPGRIGRVAGGVGVVAWSVAATFLGLWMIIWSFLGYLDGRWSENLVAWSPLYVVVAVAGVRLLRGTLDQAGLRRAQRILAVVAVASVLELALHPLGLLHQSHIGFSAYALTALALTWRTLRCHFATQCVSNEAWVDSRVGPRDQI